MSFHHPACSDYPLDNDGKILVVAHPLDRASGASVLTASRRARQTGRHCCITRVMVPHDLPFDENVLIEICRQNDVVMMGVFGSMARGESTRQSDVDLLVEFLKP